MLRKLPKTLLEFQRMFPDDEACAAYVREARWPKGFFCPRCGVMENTAVANRPWLYECHGCKKQTSIIAGTIMHATKLPLTRWFWGAYLAASHSNGISALQLQKQLGLGSYKSAWLMLAKLRRAMVDPNREMLRGIVEVDEIFIPFRSIHDPRKPTQGRHSASNMVIATAVEIIEFADKHGVMRSSAGRIRMEPLPSNIRESLHGFIRRNVAPHSLIVTDGNTAYRGMPEYFLNQTVAGTVEGSMLWTNRVASLVKTLALGTYHGYRRRYARRYLEEFVFRFNRRKVRPATFHIILGLAVNAKPATLKTIQADPLDDRKKIIGLPNPAPGRPSAKMLQLMEKPPYNKMGYVTLPLRVEEPD